MGLSTGFVGLSSGRLMRLSLVLRIPLLWRKVPRELLLLVMLLLLVVCLSGVSLLRTLSCRAASADCMKDGFEDAQETHGAALRSRTSY